ncbi:MAG: geranylgeranyl reductase family protein [candidate division WOR-3 bacterium]
MESYDAVVVGAGPAGSCAARELASRGHRVLVLERQRQVAGEIACAEGITDFWFRALGWEPEKAWICNHVQSVRVYGPTGEYFHVHVGHVGNILERRIFDRDLAVMAAEAGAEFLVSARFTAAQRTKDGVEVSFNHLGKDERITARLIVGADGPASAVGKAMGLGVDVPIADIHYTAQVLLSDHGISGDWLGLYAGNDIAPHGYAWLFTKRDGLANAGVGVADRKKRIDPLPYLEAFLSRYFPGGKRLARILSVVPTGGHKLKIYGDRVMLAGDAARLADPITGGGIGPAMVSGASAGQVGAEALSEDNLSAKRLSEYPKLYWSRADRKAYELSYTIREAYFDFTDGDLNYIFGQLKPLFHERSLESVDSTYIGRMILSGAPGLAALAVRKGKNALFRYLKETLFGR